VQQWEMTDSSLMLIAVEKSIVKELGHVWAAQRLDENAQSSNTVGLR